MIKYLKIYKKKKLLIKRLIFFWIIFIKKNHFLRNKFFNSISLIIILRQEKVNLPQEYNMRKCDKIECYDISPLIGDVIRCIETGDSISALFLTK